MKIEKKTRSFVPADLDIKWETVEPLFNSLLNRTIDSKDALEAWLKDRSELDAVLEEDFAWRYIRMTCNTADELLLKEFQYFTTEIEPKLAPLNDELNRKFIDCPFVNDLDELTHGILIKLTRNALDLFREENVPLFMEIQLKQQQYQSITGAMSVLIEGKEYTSEQASAFLKSTDRRQRRQAWEAITSRRLEDKARLDSLFDELLSLRHQIALNAGFENFRDYMFKALARFDYDVQDCYDFHAAISREIVPVLQEEAANRREALGIDKLMPWDMDVDPHGNPPLKPFGNGEELINKAIDCFNAIDPYMGSALYMMRKNRLFDVESRLGKAPGGYNYPLAETGAPFIFMNSANTFRDLTTMVHEGGHAVHTFLSANLELNDFKHLPSEVAELASMSMELISMDNWNVFFSDENELKRAKMYQLGDVLKTLPWVAVVDQFQHWIYTNPKHSSEERTEAFKQILAPFGNSFCNWDGYEEALGNLWQKQLHIFEVPFYYIEYAIAQLGAIAIWKNYKERPAEALAMYKEALKLGYTRSIKEIYEAAGIRFDFSTAYIHELAAFIKEELVKPAF